MNRHPEAHVQGLDIGAVHQHLVGEVGALAAALEIYDFHLVGLAAGLLVAAKGGHADAKYALVLARQVDSVHFHQLVVRVGKPRLHRLERLLVRSKACQFGRVVELLHRHHVIVFPEFFAGHLLVAGAAAAQVAEG